MQPNFRQEAEVKEKMFRTPSPQHNEAGRATQLWWKYLSWCVWKKCSDHFTLPGF